MTNSCLYLPYKTFHFLYRRYWRYSLAFLLPYKNSIIVFITDGCYPFVSLLSLYISSQNLMIFSCRYNKNYKQRSIVYFSEQKRMNNIKEIPLELRFKENCRQQQIRFFKPNASVICINGQILPHVVMCSDTFID
jgi:hypothetical protein